MTASIRAGGPDGCNLAIQGSHVCGKAHIFNAEGPDIRLRRIAERLVKAAEEGEAWVIRELMDRIDGKVPQATILQGDVEQPVRYVEVPRKAANADEWLQMQTPALAQRETESGTSLKRP
jgi:hypothetical protein